MTFATHPRALRIMAGGAVALGALFVVGAVVQVPRTEADLATRLESKLAAGGMVASAAFSGQDATLSCAAPLGDPARAVTLAHSVWGVRGVEVDISCGVPGAPVAPTSTSVPTTSTSVPTNPTSVAATTSVVESTVAATVPPTTLGVAPPLFTATLLDGTFILDGAIVSELQRLAMIDRASTALSPSNVIDNLTVDSEVLPVPGAQFNGLLDVLAVMPTNMVSAALGWNGSDVSLVGAYASDDARAAVEAAATQAGVVAILTQRPTATAEQGAALEAELNALVSAQSILFGKGSITISLSSLGTVQQVAGIAKRYGGLTVEVQGHTDSEGDPVRNMTLSEQRAVAVRDALIALGVPAADLTSKGFGVTQLVRDSNGNQLPEESRRVVFGVTLI